MADLPEKLYYSIREVSEHTGVEPHVLRYWESEFPTLKPKRARSGARNYRRKDVDLILEIQTLLHDEGYRIEGARKHLRERKRAKTKTKTKQKPQSSLFESMERDEKIAQLRKDLTEVMKLLKEMKSAD